MISSLSLSTLLSFFSFWRYKNALNLIANASSSVCESDLSTSMDVESVRLVESLDLAAVLVALTTLLDLPEVTLVTGMFNN